ncbi:hypothetical protein [Flavicella sp.]|uniref:hypothetical protein n=1 Tax=Flavicella sp. TaxID=2957742 RepID=UPI00301B16BE
MKAAIIYFLKELPTKPELQFNEALSLYMKSSNPSPQTVRYLNTAGYSKVNLENLLYDLKKQYSISEAEIRGAKLKSKKVILLVPAVTISSVEDLKKYTSDEILAWLKTKGMEMDPIPTWSKGTSGNRERKEFIEKYKIEVEGRKNADYDQAINDWSLNNITDWAENALIAARIDDEGLIEVTAATKEEVFATAPDEVKETIKLKDEFPFLKDPATCPDEFYILVGHKFAHYERYVEAHAKLLTSIAFEGETPVVMTSEEITELALISVLDFESNQDIYEELKHYSESGNILGNHPIFIERKLKESVEALTVEKATKRMSNLENYIRRDTKKASEAEGDDKLKYDKKVVEWNVELQMIKTKFNFSDKE